MAKFRVGDLVKIREWNDTLKNSRSNDSSKLLKRVGILSQLVDK